MYEAKRNVLGKWKLVDGGHVISVDSWGKLVSVARPTGDARPLEWDKIKNVLEVHRRNWRAITGKTVRFSRYSEAMGDYLKAAAVDLNGAIDEQLKLPLT